MEFQSWLFAAVYGRWALHAIGIPAVLKPDTLTDVAPCSGAVQSVVVVEIDIVRIGLPCRVWREVDYIRVRLLPVMGGNCLIVAHLGQNDGLAILPLRSVAARTINKYRRD